jgi:hypothetical protein
MRADPTVEALFAEYDRHPGDREAMLRAVASWRPFERVLYAGSYIDLSPAFVFPPTSTPTAGSYASSPIGLASTA